MTEQKEAVPVQYNALNVALQELDKAIARIEALRKQCDHALETMQWDEGKKPVVGSNRR
jgi:prefoldin subunit 5